MRLIDADEFKRQVAAASIKSGFMESAHKANVMIELIDMQSTAYDVDSVVEELDKDAQMLYSTHAFEPVKAWENKYLIPIIKSGGIHN